MAADVAASMLTIEKFSAERGDANSQYFMGEHYELGDSGVTQSYRIALDWYQKAAAQGHAAALYKLAQFHEKGLSVPADMGKAMELYRQAAEGGSHQAIQRIAALNKSAREDEQQRQRQLEQEQKAKAEEEARREQLRRQQTEMRLKVELEKKRALEQERQETARLAALKAEPKVEKKPSYDAAQLIGEVLNKEWRAEGRPAEFLPTGDTGCLKSSETEVTCFSQERTRAVAGKQVKYALKAVLHDFRDSGAFSVNYIYNVVELKDASGQGEASDRYGLQSREGWQQPGMDVRCEMSGAKRIQCSGAKVKAVIFEAL